MYVYTYIRLLVTSLLHITYVHIEERTVEEGQNSFRSSKDFTIVIAMLCIAGLIVIVTILIAFSAVRYECKRSKLRRPDRAPQRYQYL